VEEPVKPETARGIRRSVPRRRRARGRPDPSGNPAANASGWSVGIEQPIAVSAESAEADDAVGDRPTRIQPVSQGHRAGSWNADSADGFDPAEFAEFLEADDSPIPADPVFKERLRQRLWGMVRDHASAVAPPAPSRIGDRARRPQPDPNTKRPR
jgi:hypothetical protein